MSLIVILIIVAALVLGFFVLVQKPKGNGLTGSFGSVSSQVMGVKQSNDVMERGTWYTMTAIVVLSIATIFFSDSRAASKAAAKQQKAAQQQQQQQGQQPKK